MGTRSGTSCMLSRSSTNELQPQLPSPSLFKTPLSCWRSQDILLSNTTFSFWILLTALWTIRHVPLLSIKNTCGIYKRDLISFSQNMEGIGDTVDTFPVCSRSDLSLQRVAKFTLLTINAHRLQSHYLSRAVKWWFQNSITPIYWLEFSEDTAPCMKCKVTQESDSCQSAGRSPLFWIFSV